MPQQTANPKVYYSGRQTYIRKLKIFKQTKWVVSILMVLILASVCLLIAASYLSFNIPLVGPKIQREVDYLVASVPVLPKTPKQVLIKAFEDSKKIKTAKEKFTLTAGSGDIVLGSMTVSSQIDARDLENVLLSASINGNLSLGSQNEEMDLEIIETGDDLYFKLNKAPTLPSYDLSAITKKWYKLNVGGLSKDIKSYVRSDEDIKSDVEGNFNKAVEFIEKEGIFKKIKSFPAEKIGGRDSYHFQLSLDTPTMLALLQELSSEFPVEDKELTNNVKEVNFDAWIDKTNFYLNKLEATVNVSGVAAGSSGQLGSNAALEIKLNYEVSEINQDIVINTPSDAKQINSILDLMLLVGVGQFKTTSSEPVLGASRNVSEFGSNILLIERFLHVVTLFPSSI